MREVSETANEYATSSNGIENWKVALEGVAELFESDPKAGAESIFRTASQIFASGRQEQVRETIEFRRLKKLTHLDPITRRASEKPRGYSGDAVLLDLIYADSPPVRSGMAGDISERVHQAPECHSVRWRRDHIAQLVGQRSARSCLSVAAGHLREFGLVDSKPSRWVALDQDGESLAEIEQSSPGVQTIQAGITSLLKRSVLRGEQFDFVYAAGLFDYLDDRVASALLERLCELAAGGSVVVANFAPHPWSQGYMECFMDWHLILRSEREMSLLAPDRPHETYRDPNGSMVYLDIEC